MTNGLSNERYQEAMELHAQIMASGSTAARALVEFARLLKRMKDERLYEVFNQSFDDYVENQVGIRKRQAYTYIAAYERLGEQVMMENAKLGITKLELLSQVSPIERDDVAEKYDLENMSAADMKRLVDDLNNKGEQLTFALEENERLKSELDEANTWAKGKQVEEENGRLLELEKLLEQERMEQQQKIDEAVRKARAEVTASQSKAVKDAVEQAVAANTKKIEKAAAKDLEKAKEEAAKAAAADAQIRYEQADRKNEELRAELDGLKKKMAIAGNQDAAIVSAYCKTVLAKVLNELVEMIGGAKERDAEQGAKLARAAAGLLGSAKAQIEGLAED